MDHEDKQPEIKTEQHCGSDIACKTLTLSKPVKESLIKFAELLVIN
jgi:hypothetical protein